MIVIRDYTETDFHALFPMLMEFFSSSALSNPLNTDTVEQIFKDALHNGESFRGLIIEKDGNPCGFAHISAYYCTEVAGTCLMIEDLFVAKGFRGLGIAKAFWSWLFENYNGRVKRYRLEVMSDNAVAIQLYRNLGFKTIKYDNMILDIK